MRKNYFLSLVSVLMLTLFSTSASADVQSMTDLFGKYKFTADVEILDPTFEGEFLSECEVTISKEHSVYDATITGLGGATDVQQVSSFDAAAHTFTVINPNPGSGLWSGAYFSNAEGKNPYGSIQRDFKVVYTFDPETKEITMDDFTVVTVSNWESDDANIIAKFSNVKMTLIESEKIEISNVSGDWTFTTSAYDEKSDLPTTFVLSLESTSADFKNYNATISFEGYEAVTTTATFNGVELVIPFDSLCIDKENGIFLANYQGTSVKGEYEFSYTSATTMALSSGMSIVKRYMTTDEEGNPKVQHDYLQYYTTGVLKLPGTETDFDWEGTYTVKSDTIMNGSHADKYSNEFTFVVEYHETWQMYLITEFMGRNVVDINYGGIEFNVAEDGKSATIKTNQYLEFNAEYDADSNPTSMTARIINDINLGNNPLTLTLNEDGTLSLSPFCISHSNLMTNESNVEMVYQNSVVLKEEAEDFSWSNGFTVTSNVESLDGGEYPATFAMEISYDETAGEYRVLSFLGYDIASMTYGGVLLNIDEETGVATMPLSGNFGNLCITGEYPNYIMLGDANGGNSGLQFNINEDGTISISDFALYAYNWDNNSIGKKVAAYSNVLATVVDTAAFDWSGKYVFTIYNPETYNYDEYSIKIAEDDGKYYVETFMNYELGSLNYGGLLLTVSSDDVKKASIKLNGGYGGALLAMLDNYNYLQLRDSVGGTESLGVTLNNNGTLTIDKFQIVESTYGNGIEPVGEPVAYPSVVAMKGGYTTDIKAPYAEGTSSETINFNGDQNVSVYDTAGRKVYTGAANNVNTLPAGLYIVKGASAAVKLNIR